jgi:hypothetical protein
MPYSKFDLQKALDDFGLKLEDRKFLPDFISLEPSEYLKLCLRRGLTLALAIDTEKARSEMLISPILLEVKELLAGKVALFSGRDFTVNPERELTGVCDYLISRSSEQLLITAPVAVVVEAKKDNLNSAMGQCIAEMVAAQQFNQIRHNPISTIYGVITTGDRWRFLQLQETLVSVDLEERRIPPVNDLLGILVAITGGDR